MPSAAPKSLFVLVLGAFFAACSTGELLGSDGDDPIRQAAINLIEADLAPQIGLGPLIANCDGNELGPGASFTCTALTTQASSGVEPIRFEAIVGPDGAAVEVASTNLLLADQVEQIESTTATVLAPRVDWVPRAGDVECADRSIILDEQMRLICVVVDPGTTDDASDDIRYPASIEIEDIATLRITVSLGSAQN